MSYYGAEPVVVAKNIPVDLLKDRVELGFTQYLPIKMAGALESFHIPPALNWIKRFIPHLDFCPHTDYIYVSAKHLFVTPDNMGNRPGWHSDGFGSDDINYIWSDSFPTQFCLQEFELTEDHVTSLQELADQALDENIVDYGVNAFVRIDRWNIHRPPVDGLGFRTFLKFSISKNQYNLQGNSHNYLIDYDWEMVPRSAIRNHPVADIAGKVPELDPTNVMITLPGAYNKQFALDKLIHRLARDNVSVFPIMNVSTKMNLIGEDQQISLEYILRDILVEMGFANYVNMNQSKPMLVDELISTGLFTRIKANGVSYNGSRPPYVKPQKFYKHPVNCLWYVPLSKRM